MRREGIQAARPTLRSDRDFGEQYTRRRGRMRDTASDTHRPGPVCRKAPYEPAVRSCWGADRSAASGLGGIAGRES